MENEHMARPKHEIRDERSNGNGWFVYLSAGWQLDGAHCFGEDRRRDVTDTLKRVKKCECQECQNLQAKERTRNEHIGN